jgi:hypothetical protein
LWTAIHNFEMQTFLGHVDDFTPLIATEPSSVLLHL